MSPEQARGKSLDRRTDIWSFGCVFYEALTGRKAFMDETVSDILAAILEREPGLDSSMFAYATEILHLSEAEAYLRIAVARAARRFPVLLCMLGDGRLHLSGIAVLAPHLTDENCESVLARAVHKSKRQIEELAAELAPKPDVLSTIRKLPAPPPVPAPAVQLRPDEVAHP